MLFNTVRRKHGDMVLDEMAVFVATDRRKYEHELLLARKNAEHNYQELNAARLALQESRDALEKVNVELERADIKKDEFLATLAHELRNPLAPMGNVLAILKLKSSTDPQLLWAQEVFERQMQQMSHLVDDLMEISRITQGRIELRKAPTSIALVMRSAIEASDALVRASEHKLSTSFPVPDLVVDGDSTRLTQILTNLLNNAAKYTPDGGRIWFDAARENGEVVITVRDSGIGIASENLLNVFTMFAQLEPGLKRAQGGLGIGLALVKGLVALHGGTIGVESAGVGQGSEFTVRLPLLEAGVAAPQSDTPAPAATASGRRVLVVDDNRDSADMLRMALEMLGYEARCAYDGQQALKEGKAFEPAVVVLDIGLPDMDGYAVARGMRQLPWGQRAILVAATGWGQQRDRDAALEAGFDHHMVKPVDFDALKNLMGATSLS